MIRAGWIEHGEIEGQRFSYPKRPGRMVREVIVGQPMDERTEPVRPDPIEDRLERIPVEVDFVLGSGMRTNGPVCHRAHKDDVDQVTGAFVDWSSV